MGETMNDTDFVTLWKKKTRWAVPAAACAAIAFAALCFFVIQNPVNGFDTAIHDWFVAIRVRFLNPLIIAITYSGNWQAITPVCAVLLAIPKTRKRFGLPLATAALTCVGIYELSKKLIGRPRPSHDFFLVEQGGFSFPSGHAMTSVVFFFLLAMILWDLRCEKTPGAKFGGWSWLCVVWAFLIGLSRLYVGVHWATDILGGWCISCILIIAFAAIWDIGILSRKRVRAELRDGRS
jgi:undecaprenyl-diphosphatase